MLDNHRMNILWLILEKFCFHIFNIHIIIFFGDMRQGCYKVYFSTLFYTHTIMNKQRKLSILKTKCFAGEINSWNNKKNLSICQSQNNETPMGEKNRYMHNTLNGKYN